MKTTTTENQASGKKTAGCYIAVKMPGLNDYVRECRGNRYLAARTKKNLEYFLCVHIKQLPVFEGPVLLEFEWIEKDRKRDPDNVAFAKKFILDALVKAGKIPNDTAHYIAGFRDRFTYADEYAVNIQITEA